MGPEKCKGISSLFINPVGCNDNNIVIIGSGTSLSRSSYPERVTGSVKNDFTKMY